MNGHAIVQISWPVLACFAGALSRLQERAAVRVAIGSVVSLDVHELMRSSTAMAVLIRPRTAGGTAALRQSLFVNAD